ncbi:FoF1 ATP synthase subunit delta/epsilon [Blattabacterium cuenoti]|uniref:FoF1 ATP synthase subunit delta/epsilon n=1 Tax=Blattabacterium cuenoti TaxID=1653831 RepID=UPI00163CD0CD|nr:F0F1 ATP synthase subunit epsilon [Blattabacterium cuenoti]
MKIKIIYYNKNLYKENIISIIAPGLYGYFQILENHDYFISILKNGIIKFYSEVDNQKKIKIKGGILQVKNNFIIILL